MTFLKMWPLCGWQVLTFAFVGLWISQSNAQTLDSAVYNSTYKTGVCLRVGANGCDSGGLYTGRANLGPENAAPNTLYNRCADGTSGIFHTDESVDRIRVFSIDGSSLSPGKTATVEVTVWAYSSYTTDKLDLYYASNATSPSWTFLGTMTPVGSGAQKLSKNFNLSLTGGSVQAVRAAFRYQGGAGPCASGAYNDRDDLAFSVSTTDASFPSVSVQSPSPVVGAVTITASASDNIGVSGVQFKLNGSDLGTEDLSNPFSVSWNTTSVPNGTHVLSAVARDAAGNKTTASNVSVMVSNSSAPPPPTGSGPSITSLSGTVQIGQTLTITGANMVNEDKTNWDPFYTQFPNAAGFEGSSYAADGWEGGTSFSYVSDVKLMGSKSALSYHAGATSVNQTNVSYSERLSISGDIYIRAYLRFKVANGIWADNYHKIFASYAPNGVWLDWVGNGGGPYTHISIIKSSNHYGQIPGGAIKENRWYLVEFKMPSGSPHNYKAWIDNKLVIDYNDTTSPQGTAWDLQFDVNHCCTAAGYAKSNWWDGFVVSKTRVGPASLIEIGNSADYATATKVYQAPEFLSDSSSQFKADLTGLGAGPYYLWITNNRGQRSQPFALP